MRVALTHSEGRFEGLAAALRGAGLVPLATPLVATRPRVTPEVRARAEALLALPWLLVTSRSVVEAWRALGLPWGGGGPRLGAVGPATARALEAAGARVSLVGEPATAEGLAATFAGHAEAAGPVGVPQGARARPTLTRALQAAGFDPRPLVVYDTVTLPWPTPALGGETPDAVLLTSPTAVEALPTAVAGRTRLVAVGPTTRAAITERGWRAVTAASPALPDLVDAVRRALERAPSPPDERTPA